MAHVLFVCTGNIFRSMTAEYALRRELGAQSHLVIASAGTDDYPHVVRANVREYLRLRGLDVSAHSRRTVSHEMVAGAELVVAMSIDHQRWLAERYGVKVPVFLEACGGACEALPDQRGGSGRAREEDHRYDPGAHAAPGGKTRDLGAAF